MSRLSWKNVLYVTVVVAMLLATVQSADACWWGCGRSAYYGCYSPCYSVCNPCGGWYAGYRPYRWSYGCGYGCDWGVGYYASYSGCYSGCNAVASCCGSTTTTMAPSVQSMPTPAKKPVIEGPAAPTPAAPAMPPEPGMTAPAPSPSEPSPEMPGTTPAPVTPTEPTTSSPTPENSGVVTVWVPYDAKVTINGLATRSLGSRRQFVSFGLKPGFSYKYEIHAEVVKDGKTMEDTRTVTLTAGQNTAVAFGFTTNPTEAVASTN